MVAREEQQYVRSEAQKDNHNNIQLYPSLQNPQRNVKIFVGNFSVGQKLPNRQSGRLLQEHCSLLSI